MGLSKEARLSMTIGGEPVAEVDISSCFLSIIYKEKGVSLDLSQDLYELPGIPRWLVKAWFTAVTGNSGHLSRWPPKIAERYWEKDNSDIPITVTELRNLMEERHPVLADYDIPWSRLHFIESEGILRAMWALMKVHKVPTYPIHDCLLCRAKDAEVVRETLLMAFDKGMGVTIKATIETLSSL